MPNSAKAISRLSVKDPLAAFFNCFGSKATDGNAAIDGWLSWRLRVILVLSTRLDDMPFFRAGQT